MPATTRASAGERTRPMPADSTIPDAITSSTRAVTISAPPAAVWPWLVQMGAGRAGWYSYDFVDNGGVPSSWSILPGHQSVSVGDIFPALPAAKDAFVLSVLDPGHGLVLTAPFPDRRPMVTWEFILEPAAPHSTRLLFIEREEDEVVVDPDRLVNVAELRTVRSAAGEER